MAEAAAQTSQQKRASTSLLKEMIGGSGSKFLISTKSHEGLMNHQHVSMSIAAADQLGYNTANNQNSNASAAAAVNRDTNSNNGNASQPTNAATNKTAVPLAGQGSSTNTASGA